MPQPIAGHSWLLHFGAVDYAVTAVLNEIWATLTIDPATGRRGAD